MDGRNDESMDDRIDRGMGVCMDGKYNEWTVEWTVRWMER